MNGKSITADSDFAHRRHAAVITLRTKNADHSYLKLAWAVADVASSASPVRENMLTERLRHGKDTIPDDIYPRSRIVTNL